MGASPPDWSKTESISTLIVFYFSNLGTNLQKQRLLLNLWVSARIFELKPTRRCFLERRALEFVRRKIIGVKRQTTPSRFPPEIRTFDRFLVPSKTDLP